MPKLLTSFAPPFLLLTLLFVATIRCHSEEKVEEEKRLREILTGNATSSVKGRRHNHGRHKLANGTKVEYEDEIEIVEEEVEYEDGDAEGERMKNETEGMEKKGKNDEVREAEEGLLNGGRGGKNATDEEMMKKGKGMEEKDIIEESLEDNEEKMMDGAQKLLENATVGMQQKRRQKKAALNCWHLPPPGIDNEGHLSKLLAAIVSANVGQYAGSEESGGRKIAQFRNDAGPLLSTFMGGGNKKDDNVTENAAKLGGNCAADKFHHCLTIKCKAIGGSFQTCFEPNAALGPEGACKWIVKYCHQMAADPEAYCKMECLDPEHCANEDGKKKEEGEGEGAIGKKTNQPEKMPSARVDDSSMAPPDGEGMPSPIPFPVSNVQLHPSMASMACAIPAASIFALLLSLLATGIGHHLTG